MRGRPRQTQCSRGHGPEAWVRYPSGQAHCRVCRGYGAARPMGSQDPARAARIVAAIDGGLTLAAVGRQLGITRERVRQVYRQATGHGTPLLGSLCQVCMVRYLGRRAAHTATDDHRHQLRMRREARFWAHVDIGAGPDGCWPFDSVNPRTGYGHYAGFGEWNAHRVAYVLSKGPIPAKHHIDHLCRMPACVNPDHLEAVTPKENIRRGMNVALREHHVYTRLGTPGFVRQRCRRGHDLTDPTHLYVIPKTGARVCRTCHRARHAEYYQRVKARREALRPAA